MKNNIKIIRSDSLLIIALTCIETVRYSIASIFSHV